jgi:hypothetical protein
VEAPPEAVLEQDTWEEELVEDFEQYDGAETIHGETEEWVDEEDRDDED